MIEKEKELIYKKHPNSNKIPKPITYQKYPQNHMFKNQSKE